MADDPFASTFSDGPAPSGSGGGASSAPRPPPVLPPLTDEERAQAVVGASKRKRTDDDEVAVRADVLPPPPADTDVLPPPPPPADIDDIMTKQRKEITHLTGEKRLLEAKVRRLEATLQKPQEASPVVAPKPPVPVDGMVVVVPCAQCAQKDVMIATMDKAGKELTDKHNKCTPPAEVDALKARLTRAETDMALLAQSADKEMQARVKPRLDEYEKAQAKATQDTAQALEQFHRLTNDLRLATAQAAGYKAALEDMKRDHATCKPVLPTETVTALSNIDSLKRMAEEYRKKWQTADVRGVQLLEIVRLTGKFLMDLASVLSGAGAPPTFGRILTAAREIRDQWSVTTLKILTDQNLGVCDLNRSNEIVWKYFNGAFVDAEDKPLHALLQFVKFNMDSWAGVWYDARLDYLKKTVAERVQEARAAAAQCQGDQIGSTVRALESQFDADISQQLSGTSLRGTAGPSTPHHFAPRRLEDSFSAQDGFGVSPFDGSRSWSSPVQHQQHSRPPMSPMAPTPPFVASPGSALVPRGHAFPAPGGLAWSPATSDGDWQNMKSTHNPPPQDRIPSGCVFKFVEFAYPGANNSLLRLRTHMVVGTRVQKTDKLIVAYYGMFPSAKCKSDPSTHQPYLKTYRFYDCGPRVMVIHVIGNLAVMRYANIASKLSNAPFRTKVIDFVTHLTTHHGEYFGSLNPSTFDISESTTAYQVLTELVTGFNRFIQMFHGIAGFTLDDKLCAEKTREYQADAGQGKPKLTNPCLLLLLPKSCMPQHESSNADTSYYLPATCEIHMAEITELS